MSTPFGQPSAGGDQFDPKLHNGQLLLFVPSLFHADMPTAHGASNAADTDIIALEHPDPETGKPKLFRNARVFGNLANSVRGAVGGGVILGRLGQGPNTKGNPPWILTEHTEQEALGSVAVYDAYKRGEFAQPSAPAAAPLAQQGWSAGPPVATQGGWGAPPPTTVPVVPVTPVPAAIPAVDPQLVAFLEARGVQVPPGMTQETAVLLANTFTGG